MALPAGTVKVVIGGTLTNGEEFAFGYQLLRSGGTTQFQLNQLNGSCTAALTNNFLVTAVKALFPTTVVFQTVRNYLYTGGSSAALIAESTGIGVAGTAAAASLPTQCAEVVTLGTGVPGRSARGRAYLPPLNVGVIGADGQFIKATCTTLANAFASMLGAVKAGSPEAGVPVVASPTHGSSLPITRVTVDSKVDTQRRRAQSAPATTSSFATVA